MGEELLVDPYETLKSCVSSAGEWSSGFWHAKACHTCSVSRPSGQSFMNPLCLNKQSCNVLSNLSRFQGARENGVHDTRELPGKGNAARNAAVRAYRWKPIRRESMLRRQPPPDLGSGESRVSFVNRVNCSKINNSVISSRFPADRQRSPIVSLPPLGSNRRSSARLASADSPLSDLPLGN